MGWKDIQEEVIAKLTDEQAKWLKRNVKLKVDDLNKMSTKEIEECFHRKPHESQIQSDDEPKIVNIDNASLSGR